MFFSLIGYYLYPNHTVFVLQQTLQIKNTSRERQGYFTVVLRQELTTQHVQTFLRLNTNFGMTEAPLEIILMTN